MALVIDGLVSAATLQGQATADQYAAAQDLVGDVTDLVLERGRAAGTLSGGAGPTAALDWSRGELSGGCSCRDGRQTSLCRHVVAVGLAALEHARGQTVVTPAPPARRPGPPGLPASSVAQWLTSLEKPDLTSLALELAALTEEGTRLLQTRAALATGATDVIEDELLDLVGSALRTGGFVDHRRSLRVGHDASTLLDELETHLDAGRADLTLAPLLKAVTRLRRVTEQADDSSGVIGDACQRAADLYARACREGGPRAVKVARWLVRFRETSPGWPETPLAAFLPAFDDAALRAYRTAVAALDQTHADDHRGLRFEIDRMLLELADLDGDVDAAVTILRRGDHPRYGAMLDRLDGAGRREEAVAVVDQAVADQRLSLRRNGPRASDYWLDPGEVAFRYLEAGREGDAVRVLRGVFEREPGVPSYQLLLGVAARLGKAETHREWAVEHARALSTRAGHGGLMVQLALAEGDLDEAWAITDDRGAGPAWPLLADATAETDPARAAGLYRAQLDDDLRYADKRSYQRVAATLTTMRRLYAAAGSTAFLDEEVRAIRETYRRRPALIAELDRASLPR